MNANVSDSAVRIVEFSALTPEQVRQVTALAQEVERVDGVAPLGEQPLLALERPDPSVSHFFVLVDDHLAAYAQTTDGDEASTAEIAVGVPFRGRGLAGRLVAHLLDRHAVLQFWAHGDLPGAAQLAERFGLRRSRELWVMTRSRTSAPEVSLDAGREDLEIVDLAEAYRRFGRDAVDAGILRVNNAAFSWHPEQGGWTAEQLRERMSVSWFDPHGFFVAVDTTEPMRLEGFHWTKVHPAAEGAAPRGEVYVVGVDPAAQGRGLGQALTAVGVAHLEAEGIDEVDLYVEGDNHAAIHAYERLGFTRSMVDVMYGNLQVEQ